MSRVKCQITKATLTNDDGRDVDGVIAYCNRCGHETESFGTSESSIKRCLVLMREECPLTQGNFYIAEDDWLDIMKTPY